MAFVTLWHVLPSKFGPPPHIVHRFSVLVILFGYLLPWICIFTFPISVLTNQRQVLKQVLLHLQSAGHMASVVLRAGSKFLSLAGRRHLFSSKLLYSSMPGLLIEDQKYSWLKELGLKAENKGVFHGSWAGSGSVSPSCMQLPSGTQTWHFEKSLSQ